MDGLCPSSHQLLTTTPQLFYLNQDWSFHHWRKVDNIEKKAPLCIRDPSSLLDVTKYVFVLVESFFIPLNI